MILINRYLFVLFAITTSLIPSTFAKKSTAEAGKSLCPKDGEVACVGCTCDLKTGFSACTPDVCPEIVNKVADAKPLNPEDKCRFGKTFVAECSLCDCTGEKDHCAMCAALPVKRPGQSADVNAKLNWINDNRFFSYEITGWTKQSQWQTE